MIWIRLLEVTFSRKPKVSLLFNFIKQIFYQSNTFCSGEMIQGIWTFKKQWKEIKQEIATQGLLHVTEVYALQFMNMLNSVFGADQDTWNKTRAKTKGNKNFQFISYITLINQSEPRDNFDCSYCHPKGKRSQLFLYFVYSIQPLNYIAFCTIKL